jgi:geranylgeranyl diphosphate synthase type I
VKAETMLIKPPRADHPSVETLLAHARTRVDPVLRALIDATPPGMRLVTGYHFGLWDETGSPAGAAAGKAFRPALVLASCELLGGRPEDAVPAAVAVELVHNFTLLHDDIMDGDRMRRNRPTAWSVFGVPNAILAGDVLQVMAFRLLADAAPGSYAPSVARLATCMVEICEGQHDDCAFERRASVGAEECLVMLEAKTGALFGACCALGALAAGAPPRVPDLLDVWGRLIGVAFQLVDDLLGIWGDTAATGKPPYSDLISRKKSMPVVAALASRDAAAEELARLYAGEGPMSIDEAVRATALIEATGARAWTRARVEQLVGDADSLLREVTTDPARTANLRLLADLAVRRDR